MPAENFKAEAKPLVAEHQNNLIADAYDWVCDNPGKAAGIAALGVGTLLLTKGRTGQFLKGAGDEAALNAKAELSLLRATKGEATETIFVRGHEISVLKPWQSLGSESGLKPLGGQLSKSMEVGAAEKQAKDLMTSALGRKDLIFDGKAPNVKAEAAMKNWLQSHGYEIRYADNLSGRLGQP